jgi:hypothetical protein
MIRAASASVKAGRVGGSASKGRLDVGDAPDGLRAARRGGGTYGAGRARSSGQGARPGERRLCATGADVNPSGVGLRP